MEDKVDQQMPTTNDQIHPQQHEADQLLLTNAVDSRDESKIAVISENQASVIHSSCLAPPDLPEDVGMLEAGNVHFLHRKEALSRRPSYRKILKDLSGGDNNNNNAGGGAKESSSGQLDIPESNEQEEINENDSTNQMYTGDVMQGNVQELHLHQDVLNQSNFHNNVQEFAIASLTTQPALLQQSDLGQGALWAGGGQVVVQTPNGMYQIQQNPSSLLNRGVPTSMPSVSPQQLAEDASRKRESRLMKNRDAAKECRRRKKEYVKCLETRVSVLEHQNKQLIDELKTLKEMYVHKQVDNI